MAVAADGTVVVADTGNGAVRTVSPAGLVTTRGVNVADGLFRPTGVAVDAGGAVYVTDDRGRIVALAPTGTARTLAGSFSGFRDGPGEAAHFRRPWGVAVAGEERLVVADTGNAVVRTVAAPRRGTWGPPPSPLVAPRFDVEAFAAQPLLWPIAPMDGPHEVAGTMGEARGGQGAERFHAGMDVGADEGTPVRAVRDGVVAAPIATSEFGTLNESLRIGPVTYVHLRVGRSGPVRRTRFVDGRIAGGVVPSYDERGVLDHVRVRRGTRVLAGDVVGTINPFNHVHLNVGWPGEEENPLRLRVPQFTDRVAPTIPRDGVTLYDEFGTRLTARASGRLLVSGRVRIVVDAWDQADGNRPESTARALRARLRGADARRRPGARVRAPARDAALRSPVTGPRRTARGLRAGQRHPVLPPRADALPLRRQQHAAQRGGHPRPVGHERAWRRGLHPAGDRRRHRRQRRI